jgi:hypothetical protein
MGVVAEEDSHAGVSGQVHGLVNFCLRRVDGDNLNLGIKTEFLELIPDEVFFRQHFPFDHNFSV